MKLRPLHDYVIVRRKAQSNLSSGGIVIPDTATEKPVQGEVVAVGNGKIMKSGKVIPLNVKPGDLVLLGNFSGSEIKIDGNEWLVLHETEILAVLEKQAVTG